MCAFLNLFVCFQFDAKTMMTLEKCYPNDGCISEAEQKRPLVNIIAKFLSERISSSSSVRSLCI